MQAESASEPVLVRIRAKLESTGEALPLVWTAIPSTGGAAFHATSEHGEVLIRSLPPGDYRLLIGFDGYALIGSGTRLHAGLPGWRRRVPAATSEGNEIAGEPPAILQVDFGVIVEAKLTDRKGVPMENATIELRESGGGDSRRSSTDERGNWRMQLLPGSYNFLISKPGRKPLDLRAVWIHAGMKRLSWRMAS